MKKKSREEKKREKEKEHLFLLEGIYNNTTLVFMGYGDRVKSSAIRIYLSTHELAGPVAGCVHVNFAPNA